MTRPNRKILSDLRDVYKVRQVDLAADMGVDAAMVSRKLGSGNLSIFFTEAVAKRAHLTMGSMFTDDSGSQSHVKRCKSWEQPLYRFSILYYMLRPFYANDVEMAKDLGISRGQLKALKNNDEDCCKKFSMEEVCRITKKAGLNIGVIIVDERGPFPVDSDTEIGSVSVKAYSSYVEDMESRHMLNEADIREAKSEINRLTDELQESQGQNEINASNLSSANATIIKLGITNQTHTRQISILKKYLGNLLDFLNSNLDAQDDDPYILLETIRNKTSEVQKLFNGFCKSFQNN